MKSNCGGEGGIRTHEALRLTHFPGVLLRPLGHLTIFYFQEFRKSHLDSPKKRAYSKIKHAFIQASIVSSSLAALYLTLLFENCDKHWYPTPLAWENWEIDLNLLACRLKKYHEISVHNIPHDNPDDFDKNINNQANLPDRFLALNISLENMPNLAD